MTKNFIPKSSLKIANNEYKYFSLNDAANKVGRDISKLPFSLKVLLENPVNSVLKQAKSGPYRLEQHFALTLSDDLHI